MEPTKTETTDAGASRQQKSGMRAAIYSVSTGVIANLAFSHGFLLLYFTARGISSTTILILLSGPELADTLLMIPAAYYSDEHTTRRTP